MLSVLWQYWFTLQIPGFPGSIACAGSATIACPSKHYWFNCGKVCDCIAGSCNSENCPGNSPKPANDKVGSGVHGKLWNYHQCNSGIYCDSRRQLWFLNCGMYSKSWNIQPLQDWTFARYHKFLVIITSPLTCLVLYLGTSWTDQNIESIIAIRFCFTCLNIMFPFHYYLCSMAYM